MTLDSGRVRSASHHDFSHLNEGYMGRRRAISDEDVVRIRERVAAGESQKAIGIDLGVSEGTVSSAVHGVRYYERSFPSDHGVGSGGRR